MARISASVYQNAATNTIQSATCKRGQVQGLRFVADRLRMRAGSVNDASDSGPPSESPPCSKIAMSSAGHVCSRDENGSAAVVPREDAGSGGGPTFSCPPSRFGALGLCRLRSERFFFASRFARSFSISSSCSALEISISSSMRARISRFGTRCVPRRTAPVVPAPLP